MKRLKREFTIFSLSAIDLFCSAMGAFMVISIVLFPYFRKEDLTPKIKQLEAQVAQMKQEIKKASVLAVFGIVTQKDKFVVLVDLSGSMKGESGSGKSYLPTVQYVCDSLIDALKPNQELQIIGFHSPEKQGVLLPAWQPKGELAPISSPAAKEEAKKAVADMLKQVEGGTPTGQALAESLAYPADCIFPLSDGAPNDPWQGIADETTQKNAGKKEIHCVAIGDYNQAQDLTVFLMELADRNNGQFLGMPPID